MNEVKRPRPRYGWPRSQDFRKGDRVKWTYEGRTYYGTLLGEPRSVDWVEGFVVSQQPEHYSTPSWIEVSWLSFA